MPLNDSLWCLQKGRYSLELYSFNESVFIFFTDISFAIGSLNHFLYCKEDAHIGHKTYKTTIEATITCTEI